MSKHYPANLRAQYFDDEELPIPAWAWLLALVVILLLVIVR